MQRARSPVVQEVPTPFAELLREMRDNRDPRLNAVLEDARGRGWRTATLADVLDIAPAACSKRIERAEPTAFDVFARQCLRLAARQLQAGGAARPGALLHKLAIQPDVRVALADAIEATLQLSGDAAARALGTLRRAERYRQPDRADISDIDIPLPQRVQTMMNGRRLPRDVVEKLREQQKVAARVNGATKEDDPRRQVSVQFTEELDRLVREEKYTPYYLAKELGITHRAITSRLERHQFREPCPSVAGTASGVYQGRRVGHSGPLPPAEPS